LTVARGGRYAQTRWEPRAPQQHLPPSLPYLPPPSTKHRSASTSLEHPALELHQSVGAPRSPDTRTTMETTGTCSSSTTGLPTPTSSPEQPPPTPYSHPTPRTAAPPPRRFDDAVLPLHLHPLHLCCYPSPEPIPCKNITGRAQGEVDQPASQTTRAPTQLPSSETTCTPVPPQPLTLLTPPPWLLTTRTRAVTCGRRTPT
jgi:hypothetical protein